MCVCVPEIQLGVSDLIVYKEISENYFLAEYTSIKIEGPWLQKFLSPLHSILHLLAFFKVIGRTTYIKILKKYQSH